MPAKPRALDEEVIAAQRGVALADALAGGAAARRGVLSTGSVAQELDVGERLTIIDALLVVLEGAYVHLPQKRAAYAADPLQALRLLRRRCGEFTPEGFHLELTGIIARLRDAHTRYQGPEVSGGVARLPFLVEQWGPPEAPRFLVSKVAERLVADRQFRPGVELEWWNGVPMARALDRYADQETGGRPDARRARALDSLTLRSLKHGPPPDEHWVDVGYRTRSGVAREVRLDWRVIKPGWAAPTIRDRRGLGLRVAEDPARQAVRRAKKLLFAPALWQLDQTERAGASGPGWLPTDFHDTLAGRRVAAPNGPFGYLRIWSFDVADDGAFLDEVSRLLDQLPDRGLILDLRSNPGGSVWAAERLLQLFTPNPISPTRFALAATPLTRAMAAAPLNQAELGAWSSSLEQAVVTGEQYSQPLPLTDPESCNDIGQRYGGPVVAVTDANTYSAADLFAAGFVDNGIGTLVTVGTATGAGGANVWTDQQLRDCLAGTDRPLPPLPDGTSFSIAIRRAIRSGSSDGVPIEDLGIAGEPYDMTKADLLESNRDLIGHCVGILSAEPWTRLRARVGSRGLRVETRGLDRLDVLVDGRPQAPRDVVDGRRTLGRVTGDVVEVVGYGSGEVLQRRRLPLT